MAVIAGRIEGAADDLQAADGPVHAESAYGPTNNCIGIGDVLRRQGHRVVFAAEASWKGRLEPLGFEEDLVDLAPPSGDQDAGQFWKDFVAQTAPEFRKPTIEQLSTFIKPVWGELIEGARYCHPQLTEIIARTRPDVIVEDNVVAFPALQTAGVPYVRIVSCNPLEVTDPGLPPAFSGYPADGTGRSGRSSGPSTTGCTGKAGARSATG
jgi:UDP:flavonoid glycosyltransferase YjiC (YdhE family)